MGRILIPLLLAALLAGACGSDPAPEGPEPGEVLGEMIERAPAAPEDTPTLVEGVNEFAFDYQALLAEREPEENVVFSPLSIAIAFGMADAGARGATAEQIEDVFHFPASGADLHLAFNALDQELESAGPATLRLANRLYPREGYPIEPGLVDTLARFYGAPLERLDFAGDSEGARKRINAWVSERTERRIPELLPQGAVSPETVLLLVNALFLEAKWTEPFGKYPTQRAPFIRLDGTKVRAPLMENAELETRFVDGDPYQAAELPLSDGFLSLLVVVPNGDFVRFAQGFDATQLAEFDAAARTGYVDLFLPKWKSTTSLDLAETLPALGLALPFGGGDFTGISPDNPFIDTGIHAATIAVDEFGVVATAATGLGFAVSGPPEPQAVIRADRPFLYLIRDTETGAVLFLGRVVDPTTGS